jgi:signal transduction histidine kinase
MTAPASAAYRACVSTRVAVRPPEQPAWPWPWQSPAVLAALVGLIQVVITIFAAQGQPERRSLDLLAFALLVAGPAALLARRRYPVHTLAAVTAITLAYLLIGYPYGPVVLSMVVALANAVILGYRAPAWIASGVLYFGHFALRPFTRTDEENTWLQAAAVGAWLLLILVASEFARVRREQVLAAARGREEAARRQASEERLRMAQELHDVLAHNISLINVQAGVALHLMDERPEQARTALTAIKQASQETLNELRTALGVLRQGDGVAPRRPAPGLADLDDLVGRAASAGLDVSTVVSGTPRPVSAGVDLAAFRIVQEALTNVVRHAGSAIARVSVEYGDRELTVQVDDDGRGVSATEIGLPGAGSGIAGMRERVTALGGTLWAGSRTGGGFRVVARLPIDPVDEAAGEAGEAEPVQTGSEDRR